MSAPHDPMYTHGIPAANSDKPTVLVYGDGVHDDSAAIQAIIDGKAVGVLPNGDRFPVSGRTYAIGKTLQLGSGRWIGNLNLSWVG